MNGLDLAVVGNCNFSALIDRAATVVWACLPRVDGDPVFCSLLNGGATADGFGFFEMALDGYAHSDQAYVPNTAVLRTTMRDTAGNAVQVTDCVPRFRQFGRFYRPSMLVRHIVPIAGTPRIRVRLRPASDYGARRPTISYGSNHIRYIMEPVTLRLSTDVPLTYVVDESAFRVERPLTMILGPDETLTRGIADTARDFIERSITYWREWVRYLSIPFEWQEAVIRAAITLKLCNFEETGAIVAALTTSVPEIAGSIRNWDYRYCWLRDAYFVVRALNRLGATLTMENYLGYLGNVIASSNDGRLQPVYGVGLESTLTEREQPGLIGYRGMGPVRTGNQAYAHVQHDVYGSVVMATAQSFFDQRLERIGDVSAFHQLERIGEHAVAVYDRPDAGLWEYRTIARVHTFSAAMCWAACDRLARIAERLAIPGRAAYWRAHADSLHGNIARNAWNASINSFVSYFGGADVDASLLLLHELGFLAADDPRFAATVDSVAARLKRGNFLMRYAERDDFGVPKNAFLVCTFWYVEALAALGRHNEARELFENTLAHRNHLGLMSEDIDPASGELWGNFPQTYSLVGLISAALRISKSWEDAF